MTLEVTVKVLAAGVAIAALCYLIWKLQGPRARTEHLVMTVWAAFGPYESAERAVDSLRWATLAVFGKDGLREHSAWFEGHANNFQKWETEGSLQKMQNFMCKGLRLTASGRAWEMACREFKAQALNEAATIAESLGKDSPALESTLQSIVEQHRKQIDQE